MKLSPALALTILPIPLAAMHALQGQSGRHVPTVSGALISVPVQKAGNAYPELFSQLRDRAVSEVAEGNARPVTFASSWGIKGAKVMIGAVTPRRATFYVVDAGPYRPGAAALALLGDRVEVCRVEVNWADAPFNGDPRSMTWIQAVLPGPDCTPAAPAWFDRYKARREQSADSVFTLLGRADAEGVAAALVAEKQSKKGRLATDSYSDPFDPDGAIELVAGKDDKIASTTPLPNLGTSSVYAVMRSGRVFITLAGSEGGFNGCVVENVSWDDVSAKDRSPRLNAANVLCNTLRRSRKY